MTRLTFTLLSLLTIALLVAGAFFFSREAMIADAMCGLEPEPIKKAILSWRTHACFAAAVLCGLPAIPLLGITMMRLEEYANRKPTP